VSVVSMSWGFAEGQSISRSDEATYDRIFQQPGVTFLASTGDAGAGDPQYPAASPEVVAVGGTSLYLNADGSYNRETGWGDSSQVGGASIGSGGGISRYEGEPSYQQGVQSLGDRTTPDVSLVADPATGVWVAVPSGGTGGDRLEVAGGTSLSAPAWAGLLALVNQGRAAAGESALNSSSPTEALQALYSLPRSDYHIITSGGTGDSANSGYSLVTGLGTPVANSLVPDLVAYHGRFRVLPSSRVTGTRARFRPAFRQHPRSARRRRPPDRGGLPSADPIDCQPRRRGGGLRGSRRRGRPGAARSQHSGRRGRPERMDFIPVRGDEASPHRGEPHSSRRCHRQDLAGRGRAEDAGPPGLAGGLRARKPRGPAVTPGSERRESSG
jgi:hypothetical protein